MPYIHFNSNAHRSNKKDKGARKTLVYRRTRTSAGVRCDDVRFTNASGYFCYFPDRPLKCGAVAWVFIEEGDVELVSPEQLAACNKDCVQKPKKKTKINPRTAKSRNSSKKRKTSTQTVKRMR